MKVLLITDGYLGTFSKYLETHVTGDGKENVEMIKRSFVYMISKINLDIKSHTNDAEIYREAGYDFIDRAITILNTSFPDFLINAENLKTELNIHIN